MKFKPRSEFLKVMQSRGFIHGCTDFIGLDDFLVKPSQSAYIGFDATADSLHVGSLIQIMMLRWLQRTGHRPIVLMGGGTTKIGDPSGKDESRKLLSPQDINRNILGIRQTIENYLDFADSPTGAIIPNNAEWLDPLNYVDFLRDYGRHFTVNRMLTFDSVRSRLDREQPLTFLEFNYMLLQAFDFMELNKRFGCRVQMGGSDQWGNIVNGVDLTRRVRNVEVFGLTSPLLTRADGSKMGKTASGAVWLNPNRISAFEFWQFWRNTPDADTGPFLRLYTELPLDECDRMGALSGSEINEAKIQLATEVTSLAFDRDTALNAQAAARGLFQTSTETDTTLVDNLPVVHIAAAEAGDTGVSIVQLLLRSGLAQTGKEAKRLIRDGGARVDERTISDSNFRVTPDRLTAGILLSAGKKRHVRVVCPANPVEG
ncbi:MAG: tyrosine--tRNA ligase [Paracoccaceae bacterium]|nr:tyrosine--tRNA ligase [Paracoccaceae bacterium]MDE2915212.1 tyrosine--tRNA ligase [Paracoccaceae bacterium]